MKKKNNLIWDKLYSKRLHFSIWPWSDLVSACSKYFQFNKKLKVLEIGCGVGANVPFFLSKNCNYTGVDISKNAIEFLKREYKSERLNFIHCDYINLKATEKFDLIIDRGSITSGNSYDKIIKIINKINMDLKDNGKFICIDWYSKKTQSYKILNTKKNLVSVKKGPLFNVGLVFFINLLEIKQLLKKFKIINLSEKLINNYSNKIYSMASWSFVCEKIKN
jgi:SAM-dependent methyltransferase